MTKLFFLILFLFSIFIPFSSSAGVVSSVNCPPDKSVEVAFRWSSPVDIIVASNTSSVVLPGTSRGVFSSFLISARSDSSGVVPIVYSSGTLQNFSCVAVSRLTYEAYWQLASIFIGVLTAIAFVIAISIRW